MASLKPHELAVLEVLISKVIPEDILQEIKNDPHISAYDVTGNGYFLTIKHPRLPEKRIVCDKPLLIGESGGIETGFIVFIEKRELTIECHSWGDLQIPPNYRESEVRIRKP